MMIELSQTGASHLYRFCQWEKEHIINGLSLVIKQLEIKLIELDEINDYRTIAEIEAEIAIMNETIKEFTI
jgi:hypothetical protein